MIAMGLSRIVMGCMLHPGNDLSHLRCMVITETGIWGLVRDQF